MNNQYHQYKPLFAVLIILAGLVSCEKIIDISIPDKERKIVVNGLIISGQPVVVNLSRSLSVLENDSLIAIPGANVNLFHGNDLIGKLDEKIQGSYTLPDFTPEVGQSYRLTASANGLNPVEATAVLPPLVPMISVDTATLTGEWGQQELRLSVKFKDPAGVHNMYGFGVTVTYKEFDYSTMTYTGRKQTNQAYLYGETDRFLKDESTNFEGRLYFEDLLFDGQTKTVEFGVSDYSFYESDTVWLTINMEQIDRPYYFYMLSYNAYQQANGNPFSEPVQVYTNVTGGFGIFSGSSSASYSIITHGMRKFE
jgi:hypothetical protein